ncbi:MAG: methyl-accepting chemotaxis protein [Planctomycetota bacterium]
MTLSIRQRILALPLIPVLFLAYPLLVYLPGRFTELAREGLVEHQLTLTQLLARSIAPDLGPRASGAGESGDLHTRLQALRSASDVTGATVYEKDGRPLATLDRDALARKVPLPIVGLAEGVQPGGAAGEVRCVVPVRGGQDVVGYLEVTASLARINQQVREEMTTGFGVGAVALALCALLAVVVASFVSRRLERARQRHGSLLQELEATSTELAVSSRELLATMRQQEADTTEQATAVEESRRTMQGLLDASERIATTARGVHGTAERTRGSSEQTAERAHQLNKLTARISEVLETIKKISDRSDLLALNAALEGTKAGEAGRGFILVAEEMRRLAESVVKAVGDVKELVETIRDASQSSVLAAEEGLKLSDETARSADTIRFTSQQQQSATKQVTLSMGEIANLIRQTASGAGQSTRAIEELAARAARLNELVEQHRGQEEADAR